MAQDQALRVPRTSLLGREEEIATALRLLQQPETGLLTLTGPGGSGKTRLAVEVASRLHEQFPDGVVTVGLAAVSDADLVATAIARAFDLRETPGRSLEWTLLDHLSAKRLLLVLDNFEHVLGAAPLVREVIAGCPTVTVLVTSRSPLHLSGEYQLEVPPLPLPEPGASPSIAVLARNPAVQLFLQRARAAVSGFDLTVENAAEVAAICRRLDGLPLAIELAAPRVKLFSPRMLLARLDHPLPVLTGGPRDLPPRQRTLRDTITWSANLLTTEEQRLFRRLAVFAGGCTLDAVAAMCAADNSGGGAVLDLVTSLTDKSLLHAEVAASGEPRFTMLETIRQFALEQLGTSGEEEALRRRHAAFFLSMAENVDARFWDMGQTAALRDLDAEQENLRAALQWALQRGVAEMALQLVGALALWHFWGAASTGRRWADAALALPSADPGAVARGKALWAAGLCAYGEGDPAALRRYAEESIAVYRGAGETRLLARALTLLEHAPSVDHAAMRSAGEESIALCRGLPTGADLPWALTIHGLALLDMGDLAEANALCEEALALLRPMESDWLTAIALGVLGHIAFQRDDLEVARAWYEERLPLLHVVRDSLNVAATLARLALIALRSGDARRALSLFTEAIVRYRQLGNETGVSLCLMGLAAAVCADGSPAWAMQLLSAEEARRGDKPLSVLPTNRSLLRMVVDVRQIAVDRAGVLLGREAFATAWADGRTLSLDDALAGGAVNGDAVESHAALDSHSAGGDALISPGLTPREVEVLRLVAEGLPNRAIAARLVLSERTVGTHLANLYNKLNVSTRAAAAAYAFRHGYVAAPPPGERLRQTT